MSFSEDLTRSFREGALAIVIVITLLLIFFAVIVSAIMTPMPTSGFCGGNNPLPFVQRSDTGY